MRTEKSGVVSTASGASGNDSGVSGAEEEGGDGSGKGNGIDKDFDHHVITL